MIDEQGRTPNQEGQEPEDTQQQGETTQPVEQFDAEYVKKLRAEAAEYRRRLRQLEEKVKAQEEATLSEAEKLQRRLSELEREREHLLAERRERAMRYEVAVAAQKLGIVDPDAAVRLLDTSSLEFDESDRPVNVEEALKALVKAKPYLVAPHVSAGSPTNPATGTQRSATFTTSQIADRKFYEAHRDEIMKAVAEGRIVPG